MDRELRELEHRYASGEPVLDKLLYHIARTHRTFDFEANYVDLSKFQGFIIIDFYGNRDPRLSGIDADAHTLGPWLDDTDIIAALHNVFADLGINFPIEIDETYADPDQAVALVVPPNAEVVKYIVRTLRRELGFSDRITGRIELKNFEDSIYSGGDIDFDEHLEFEEDIPFDFPPPETAIFRGGCTHMERVLSSPLAKSITFTFAGYDVIKLKDEFSNKLRRLWGWKQLTPLHLGILPNSLRRDSSYWILTGRPPNPYPESLLVAALFHLKKGRFVVEWHRDYFVNRIPKAEEAFLETISRDAKTNEEICWLPDWLWNRK